VNQEKESEEELVLNRKPRKGAMDEIEEDETVDLDANDDTQGQKEEL